MIRDVAPDSFSTEPPVKLSKSRQKIQQAQEIIYSFLLEIVKQWPPEEVLLEFKHLFIHHVESTSSSAIRAIYEVVFANNEDEFKNTLKRSCYILVNNWEVARQHKAIQGLVELFADPILRRHTVSPTLKRLRHWLENFVDSKDYQELKLFAARFDEQGRRHWSQRYTSYLLVPQYVDLTNPIEQREAARALSRKLKEQFKFELAMYTARSQCAVSKHDLITLEEELPALEEPVSALINRIPKNPTNLGDDVLRLIKMIVAKRGQFGYANIANIFIKQTQQLNYRDFKQSLKKYLIFSAGYEVFTQTLEKSLAEKLALLYEDHHDETLNNALLLRTCNRVIEYLTTENRREPSDLFVALVAQGNPLTLVIVLLKIILVCKHSRTHLEARIAELIQYYEHYPEQECQWIISFLEIFNIAFAIHAENIRYDLIRMKDDALTNQLMLNLDNYRIFSQLKNDPNIESFSLEAAVEILEANIEAEKSTFE
jgi:hypothetical protein